LPDSRSTRTKASPFFSTVRCSREIEMSGMTMAFRAARPSVVRGSTMRNSSPLCGPAVTRRRAVAGFRSPQESTVASAGGALRDEHAARAAASTSGDGPPGSVGSLPRPTRGPGRCAKMGARIGFTVSLDTLAGRLGKQVLLRLSTATARILAREMQEDLTPGLLCALALAVALEPRGREQEPIALAKQVALTLLDDARQLALEQAGIRHALEVPARLHERPPRVVQVARSDPSLLQLAPAALVCGASRREVRRRSPVGSPPAIGFRRVPSERKTRPRRAQFRSGRARGL